MRINKVFICLENEDTYTELSAPDILPISADFPPAVPKISTIDIIGGSGALDISDAVTGQCGYQNVTGKIVLAIPVTADMSAATKALYHKYHGRRCKLKLTADGKYRIGRVWVSADDERQRLRTVTLTMNAEPFWISDRTATVTYAEEQDIWNRNMVTLQGASLPSIGARGFYAICDFDNDDYPPYYAKFTLPEQSAVYMLTFNLWLFYNSGSGGSFYCDVYHGDTYKRTIPVEDEGYAAIAVKPEDNLKLRLGIWTGLPGLSVRIGLYNIKLFTTNGFTVVNGGDIRIIPNLTVSGGAATVYADGVEKHYNNGDSGLFWDLPLLPGTNTFGIVPDTVGETPVLSFSFKEEYL